MSIPRLSDDNRVAILGGTGKAARNQLTKAYRREGRTRRAQRSGAPSA
jgi:hypothetical protein